MRFFLEVTRVVQHIASVLLAIGAFLEAFVQDSTVNFARFAWVMLGISSIAWVVRNIVDDFFSKPRLLFSAPYIETHELGREVYKTQGKEEDGDIAFRGSLTTSPITPLKELDRREILGGFEFAIVRITNVPRVETSNSDAVGITAGVTAFTLEEHAVIQPTREPIFLRWWDKPEQPAGGDTYRQLRSTDITPHNPAELGLVFKKVGSADVFLYDVELHDPKHVSFVRQGTLLGSEPRFIRVVLKGKIAPQEKWFQVYSQDDRLRCIPVLKPKDFREKR